MSEIFSYFYQGENRGFWKLTSLNRGYLFYKDHYVDLVTGKSHSSSMLSIQNFLESISLKDHQNQNQYEVVHCFYEWGYFYQGLEKKIESDHALVIYLDYKNREEIETIGQRDSFKKKILFESEKKT